MKKGTPTLSSLGRALTLLRVVIEDGGKSNLSSLARKVGLPVATAHRQATSLVEFGFLTPVSGGRHMAGPELLRLLYLIEPKEVIARLAMPAVEALAEDLGTTVHLGSFDGDMVTYRAKAGVSKGGLFTEVGGQLEAYCSGIGKVLLAHLPEDERNAYLANGPFVALTPHTITDPAELAHELDHVRSQGLAFDREEIEERLRCVAVPLFAPDGSVPLALSASFRNLAENDGTLSAAAERLVRAANNIKDELWPKHSSS